ncbi:hypothetical protein CJ030_MR6G022935 [Morella rubra]|uniref:RNase H type-1 domain-containing protein n=1 Tax=Morella rubra TaxID=262757 RepID=A0A6A1WXA9_9ROSI|nr:hypothetical protein CJ030_MR6G022935 [Morella rubra]
MAADSNCSHVIIEGDSQILVNQVLSVNRPSMWLIAGEVDTMRNLLREYGGWQILWTPRAGNSMAHRLAQWGLHLGRVGVVPITDVPTEIISCDDSDMQSRREL